MDTTTISVKKEQLSHNGKSIKIKYVSFPKELQGFAGGFVSEKRDSRYLIVIDRTRIPLLQRKALGHELAHIYMNHFDQDKRPVQDIEKEANINAWKYYRLYKSGSLEAVSD
jgi:hypothetical protein